MTVDLFLKNFKILTEAPNGIAYIRKLVLQVAVNGSWRNSSYKLGDNQFLLGEVVDILDSERIPVSKDDRNPGPYPYYGASGIVDYISDYIFDEPLVLVGEDGAKWGVGDQTAFCVSGKTWVNNHAHVLRPNRSVLLDQFLVYLLNGTDIKPFITGTTVPKLNQKKLVSIPISLPPLPEQHRIVTKVDRLMALCDELEEKKQKKATTRVKLNKASLNALTTATDNGDFKTAWKRVCNNFNILYTAPETVQELRQAILQLAVMGKLVKQDANDDSSTLIDRIRTEIAQLAVEKKIKKTAILPIVSKDVPHKLPIGWSWVRLGEITNVVRGGSPRPAGDLRYYDGDIPFLKVADLTASEEMFLSTFTYTIKEAGLRKTRKVPPNTLMLTNSGATLGIPKICLFETTFNDGIAAFIYMNAELYKPYFYYLLRSLTKWFLKQASRGQGQPNLNTEIIGNTIIAIPPANEQRRIVTKVDQLMKLCDDLENNLTQSQIQAEKLMEAVVAGIVGER